MKNFKMITWNNIQTSFLFTLFLSLGIWSLPCFVMAQDKSQDAIVEYDGKWYHAGDTIYGYKNYVKLVVGDRDVPLLLGIPHDGALKGTPEIPKTSKSGRDIRTKPLVFAIARLFKEDTGLQPWVMINEMNRMRVDPNSYPSQLDKRYGKKSDARKTYESYHALMLLARTTMAEQLKDKTGGLYIDIHGQSHRYVGDRTEPFTSIIDGSQVPSNRIWQTEIGYALTKNALRKPDKVVDKYAGYTGIYAIAKAHPEVPFSTLIRGPYSFGGLLDAEGLPAVPGQQIPNIEFDAERFGTDKEGKPNERPFFTGGYLIRKYGTAIKAVGSVTGMDDNISAFQMETPIITVRKNEETIARSSHLFKRAIIKYLNHWYGYTYKNSPYPYERF